VSESLLEVVISPGSNQPGHWNWAGLNKPKSRARQGQGFGLGLLSIHRYYLITNLVKAYFTGGRGPPIEDDFPVDCKVPINVRVTTLPMYFRPSPPARSKGVSMYSL
jgi:hypothetical protein